MTTSEMQQQFLESIAPDLAPDDSFFRRMYGWGITRPEFPEKVIYTAEVLNGVPLRGPYEAWVREYEAEQAKINKEVGEWYGKWLERQEGGGGKWKATDLHQKSDKELLTLLKALSKREA